MRKTLLIRAQVFSFFSWIGSLESSHAPSLLTSTVRPPSLSLSSTFRDRANGRMAYFPRALIPRCPSPSRVDYTIKYPSTFAADLFALRRAPFDALTFSPENWILLALAPIFPTVSFFLSRGTLVLLFSSTNEIPGTTS